MPLTEIPTDLRKAENQGLSMELRFSYRSGGVTYVGSGRTRNLDADSVCFESDQELRGRGDIELHIAWPFRLQSICPLELVVRGPLVKKDGAVAVIRMDSYELRTHGERSFGYFASCGDICDLAA
jgi:hypothetical protein